MGIWSAPDMQEKFKKSLAIKLTLILPRWVSGLPRTCKRSSRKLPGSGPCGRRWERCWSGLVSTVETLSSARLSCTGSTLILPHFLPFFLISPHFFPVMSVSSACFVRVSAFSGAFDSDAQVQTGLTWFWVSP